MARSAREKKDFSGISEEDVVEMIQARFFELCKLRGYVPVDDRECWLEAEKEVKTRLGLVQH